MLRITVTHPRLRTVGVMLMRSADGRPGIMVCLGSVDLLLARPPDPEPPAPAVKAVEGALAPLTDEVLASLAEVLRHAGVPIQGPLFVMQRHRQARPGGFPPASPANRDS